MPNENYRFFNNLDLCFHIKTFFLGICAMAQLVPGNEFSLFYKAAIVSFMTLNA